MDPCGVSSPQLYRSVVYRGAASQSSSRPRRSQERSKCHFGNSPSRGLIIYTHDSRCPDVPYGDCFFQKETWIIATTNDTVPRCVLRASNLLTFTKSAFFSGQIRSRSKEEMLAYFIIWLKGAEVRGFLKQEPPKQTDSERKTTHESHKSTFHNLITKPLLERRQSSVPSVPDEAS